MAPPAALSGFAGGPMLLPATQLLVTPDGVVARGGSRPPWFLQPGSAWWPRGLVRAPSTLSQVGVGQAWPQFRLGKRMQATQATQTETAKQAKQPSWSYLALVAPRSRARALKSLPIRSRAGLASIQTGQANASKASNTNRAAEPAKQARQLNWSYPALRYASGVALPRQMRSCFSPGSPGHSGLA